MHTTYHLSRAAFYVFRSACCLFLLLSCSANRKSTSYQHTFVSDSIRIDRRDSLYMKRLLETSLQKCMRLEHITLSHPDTLGRQYIQSVSVLTADTNESHRETEEEKQTVYHKENHSTISLSEEKNQKSLRIRKPYFLIIAGIGILSLLGLMKKRG